MWVTHQGSVAILSAIHEDGAELHYTDQHGATTAINKAVPIEEVSQAAYGDIPKARRPDKTVARNFGYL
jgi:hypothetical protein